MVKEGIVLGHMISAAGLEVDQAKVSIIRDLMPPTTVRESEVSWDMQDFIEDLSETSQKLLDHYADCWKKILNSILMNSARKHLKKSNSD